MKCYNIGWSPLNGVYRINYTTYESYHGLYVITLILYFNISLFFIEQCSEISFGCSEISTNAITHWVIGSVNQTSEITDIDVISPSGICS